MPFALDRLDATWLIAAPEADMKSKKSTSVPTIIAGRKPSVLIVEARFYDDIADELLSGAKTVLGLSGVQMTVITVPGALEIPAVIGMAIRAAYETDEPVVYDGYVALGCVIRGETGHYDVVAGESNRALMDMAARDGLAIGNGILTVENREQALARARTSEMNKGGGAAQACLEMIAIQRRFGIDALPMGPQDMIEPGFLEEMLAQTAPPPRKGSSLPGFTASERKPKARR